MKFNSHRLKILKILFQVLVRLFQTISIIIVGGFHILFSWNINPVNGHSESVIRESAVIENAVIDEDSSDEDPCTDDISLVLRLQIVENSKLTKELEVYLCKICLVKNVNIIIKPCHHSTCDSCMETFINSYLKNPKSRKTCPFCNTFMQHVGKIYFPWKYLFD